ncbi:(2Fe-2S)-binding protein [Pelobacter propionicus]|uniref:(2Fe-2S)-binding domain protein n=1 Tax=Pelobacter propionicus (strain DSM 2379 / NBRC 103807 / OttBd1) TaxID=338966 RepID=A1ANZ1_PELPD|nr:(2Fe-2S)-binding protein [Pelobacter propionicus]ABK99061.1 (2Fe-2S)-binding domain protein [Pelobacter propionicus DSM 2379]
MLIDVTFELNGKTVTITTHPLRRLLDILRDDLRLTGTKEGCGEGECGACAVLLDRHLVNACLIAAASLEGKSVLTIEGYRETERFAVLSKAFARAGSVQCGFCTPGMVMAAEALLRRTPHPTEEQVREGLTGNLCRCTGYNMIVDGIMLAAQEGDGLW